MAQSILEIFKMEKSQAKDSKLGLTAKFTEVNSKKERCMALEFSSIARAGFKKIRNMKGSFT